MQSPFTGGHATLRHELSELTFRKEKFQYVHQFYECDETKERFTTTALDEVNVGQVYNQYRAKYGIPFPDEIKRIRQRYGLPASKMSQILGFGDNQYRLYENGDMPSEANGKILMSIQNPHIFESFVTNARNQFEEDEFAKILNKVKSVKTDANDAFIKDYIFNGSRRDIFNGYATQSISKLKNIILFYIEKYHGVFFTMMNKLLFYTDFYSYKITSKGMSGLAYKAIQRYQCPFDGTESIVSTMTSNKRLCILILEQKVQNSPPHFLLTFLNSQTRNSKFLKQSTSVSRQKTPLSFRTSVTTKMHGKSMLTADR